MKKILFIVNPIAGKMKILKDIGEIDKTFYRGGYDCDIYLTNKKGDAAEKVINNARSPLIHFFAFVLILMRVLLFVYYL